MAFFNSVFLDNERNALLAKMSKFQCRIDSNTEWITCREKSRKVIGNYLVVTIVFENAQKTDFTITEFRVIDKDEATIAQQELSVKINATQTVLINLKISYQEV